jgi:hypothetical protein
MRICAAKEKLGDPGERSFTQHGEENVIKLTKNYNNNDSWKFLRTWQKDKISIEIRQLKLPK